jgi:hypothetical protein
MYESTSICQNSLKSNPQRKYGLLGRGWTGRQFFIANCIDRLEYAWQQENKHTVLLSKNINVKKNDDGSISEFPEPGVPAYGFTQALSSVMGIYGFWENYDYGIERTGMTNTPYQVFDASRTPEMVKDANLRKLIRIEKGLTEDEKSWERYDLDKLFKVTSATKILNNFKGYLTLVDANLGTHFLNELSKLSEAEKELWDAQEETDSEEDVSVEAIVSMPADNLVANKTAVEEAKTALIIDQRPGVDIKFQLPGWGRLTGDERAMIDSASKDDDGTWSLKYREGVRVRSLCVECETRIPASFKYCPCCDTDQSVEDPSF